MCLWLWDTHQLVQVLPEVLGHQTEGRQKGPAKCIEASVTVIRVRSEPLQAVIALGTGPTMRQGHKQ